MTVRPRPPAPPRSGLKPTEWANPDFADPRVPHGRARVLAVYNRVHCLCGWVGSTEAYQRLHLRVGRDG